VFEYRLPTIATVKAFAEGVHHGHTYNEHEGRLNQIPSSEAVPGVMSELGNEAMKYASIAAKLQQGFI
jgi:hypothetical protein